MYYTVFEIPKGTAKLSYIALFTTLESAQESLEQLREAYTDCDYGLSETDDDGHSRVIWGY